VLHISTWEGWNFVYALLSLFPYCGKFFTLLSLFPTFSADPKRRDDRRHIFPISQHSVLNLNKRKIFALLPLFPYI